MATESEPTITLYTTKTPNGIKASIILEELGLKYNLKAIKFATDEQKEPWFLEINPNGRIPAITDKFTDGTTIRIFESGNILQYLVDRYDPEYKLSYPKGSKEYYEVNGWLFWQMGGLGPMQGQANHFFRYAPEKIQYGISRYQNETRRLYRVLDKHLERSTSGFIVGDRLTIADIASWGWVNSASWAGVDIEEFPKLKQWVAFLGARPAFEKGRNVPYEKPRETKQTPEEEEEEARKNREWIMRGIKGDAAK